MKLPDLTPAEYKRKWADLIEENLRLKKQLDRAYEDVRFENARYLGAVVELVALKKKPAGRR